MVFESTVKLPELNVDIVTYCMLQSAADDEKKILSDAIDLNDSVTLGQFKTLVYRVAAGLRAIGVQKGDCLSLLSHNDIRQPVLWFGCIVAGAIFAPLSPLLKPADLAKTIQNCGARYAVVSHRCLDLLMQAVPSFDRSKVIMFEPKKYDEFFIETEYGKFSNWSALLTHGEYKRETITDPHILMNTPTSRLFTSGTTGDPKVLETSHRSNLQMTRFREYADRSKDYEMIMLYFSPLVHVSGQLQVMYALRHGCTLYLMNYDPKLVIEKIDFLNITDFLLGPFPASDILSSATAIPRDDLKNKLKSVRHIVVGGAMANTKANVQWADLIPPRARLLNIYGSTEAGIFTILDFDGEDPDLQGGSAGHNAAGVDIKLMDPDDPTREITTYDTIGAILANSAGNFLGYYNNPSATAAILDSDGFIKLGDLGYMSSKNKQWYIVGREKEVFKINGKRVAPHEIDSCVVEVKGVKEAAVVPVQVEGKGRVEIKAFVVPEGEGTEELEGEVVKHVEEQMEDYKAITGGVEFVDAIPKTPMGKTMRSKLTTAEGQ